MGSGTLGRFKSSGFGSALLFFLLSICVFESNAQVLVRNRQEMLCEIEKERIFRFGNQKVLLALLNYLI